MFREIFGDDARFMKGITAMLKTGEVRLLAADGTELPQWRWRETLEAATGETEQITARLAITEQGARRIAGN